MSHTGYASLINTIIIKIILHTYLKKKSHLLINNIYYLKEKNDGIIKRQKNIQGYTPWKFGEHTSARDEIRSRNLG